MVGAREQTAAVWMSCSCSMRHVAAYVGPTRPTFSHILNSKYILTWARGEGSKPVGPVTGNLPTGTKN